MKELEDQAFAGGTTAEALMNEAGRLIAEAVQQFCPTPGACRVAFGKGHNGGDALVAARHLAEAGWEISLQEAFPRDALAPLTARKLEELLTVASFGLRVENGRGVAPKAVLDGLLGIGAKPGLREPIRSAASEINRLRRETGATVFALDLPTGLDGDTGEAAPDTVEADITLAIAFAKRGLVADAAVDFVGRLAVLPLPGLTRVQEAQGAGGDQTVTTPLALKAILPRRRFNTHKGMCGRVGVIAGSRGLTGAAAMAASAAVRGGAGLVSLFVTPDAYPVIAASVIPEVMTTAVETYREVLDRPFDAIAIGPGLGSNARHQDSDDLLALIAAFPGTMVIDADALNLLAASPANLAALHRCAGPRLLTPHPGEMQRLFSQARTLTRRETALEFLAPFADNRHAITLLLKGARTLIAEANGRVAYNTTGNPGMATGGMGDVLTGTCAALAGQGLPPFDAARLGAWLCGRAAEIAVSHGWQSQESLCATDLLEFFGVAFNELHGPAPVF